MCNTSLGLHFIIQLHEENGEMGLCIISCRTWKEFKEKLCVGGGDGVYVRCSIMCSCSDDTFSFVI